MTEYGLTRRQLIVADCAVAVLYAVLLVLTTGRGWSVLLAVPVAVRRIWPVPAFAVVGVMSVVAIAAGALRDPLLAAAYVLYVVALTRSSARTLSSRRLVSLAGGVGFVVLVLAVIAGAPAITVRTSTTKPTPPARLTSRRLLNVRADDRVRATTYST